jgi:hypothetical protein
VQFALPLAATVAYHTTGHTFWRSFRDIALLGVLSEKLPERMRLGDLRLRSVRSAAWCPAPASPSSPLLGPPGNASAGTSEDCRRDSLCASSLALPARRRVRNLSDCLQREHGRPSSRLAALRRSASHPVLYTSWRPLGGYISGEKLCSGDTHALDNHTSVCHVSGLKDMPFARRMQPRSYCSETQRTSLTSTSAILVYTYMIIPAIGCQQACSQGRVPY